MMKRLAFAAALTVLPLTAFAQGYVRDPANGAAVRDSAPPVQTYTAPPMTRDAAGGSMIDDTPRFRSYVVQQHVPSYRYEDELAVGTVLPQRGVVYRQVPAEYGASGYRYTVVNDQAVLVEPRTRRIVQIIE